MIVTDLADLVGARGPRVRWERTLLFALAWLLSDAGYQIILPLSAGARGWAWLSVTTVVLQLGASFVRIVLITLLAVLLLRRIPSVATAVVVLALFHAPLSRGLLAATLALRGAGSVSLASPLWDPWGLAWSALGSLCFFGGLALALRFVPWLVPALLAGAAGGQLAATLLHTGVLVATQRFAEVAATLRFLPLTLARSVVFALLLGGALLSLSARPTEVPGAPPESA